MNVKILEYNVWNGFCTETLPYKMQKTRMRLVTRLVAKENPDILILTEAYLWPFALKIKSNFSSVFEKMYSFISEPTKQFRWAPVILSKFPIKFEDRSIYRKAWLRANVIVGNKSLTLDVVHPHPDLLEDERAEFVSSVIKNVKSPYILVGDFNSLSPKDPYNKNKLAEGYSTFMGSKAEQKVNDLLKFTTVKKIISQNLKDAIYASSKNGLNYTVPTDLRSKDKRSAVRVDYIFCSSNIKIIDCGTIKNNIAERASDHYPIYAVLNIQ